MATTVEMIPRMMPLEDLLTLIDSGETVIPDFQRDFDWSEMDVRSLLVTAVCGWPAGSLLLMQGEPTFFRSRSFEDAPSTSEKPRYVVLDGQQRLTALYHAIYDRGTHVYAVDYSALITDDLTSVDESVVLFKRDEWDKRYRSLNEQRLGHLIPFYVLASAADFFAWRDEVVPTAPASEQENLKRKLTNLYRMILSKLNRYSFPVVIVESSLRPAAIARIFERVNRLGMRLGTFDLMVARLYEPTWNLRDKWEIARRDNESIELFDSYLQEEGMPILQAISLRYGFDVRQAAVLDLSRTLVQERWDQAVTAVNSAFEFLGSKCGVADPTWLPYRAMALPLAALAFDRSLEASEALLHKWFWSRAFSLAYDVASNTRLVSDYRLLLSATLSQESIAVASASEGVLFEATRRGQTAIWKAFLCVLAFRQAADLTGEGLAQQSDMQVRPDYVVQSLFPKGLVPEDRSPAVHLRALSQVIVSRSTGIAIRRGRLSELLNEAAELRGEDAVNLALDRQFLPPLTTMIEMESDWRTVLLHRLDRLAEFLLSEADQVVERAT